jgi:hypothetical protein
MRFNLKHAEALIELLSAVDGETALELGFDASVCEALEDVFEASCDYYEQVIGQPHPLSQPQPADDADHPVESLIARAAAAQRRIAIVDNEPVTLVLNNCQVLVENIERRSMN